MLLHIFSNGFIFIVFRSDISSRTEVQRLLYKYLTIKIRKYHNTTAMLPWCTNISVFCFLFLYYKFVSVRAGSSENESQKAIHFFQAKTNKFKLLCGREITSMDTDHNLIDSNSNLQNLYEFNFLF